MQSLDDANLAYWNELCGTQLANMLGIFDASAESLKKFDDWYFEFYDYLFEHVPLSEFAGRDVLEVGIGYGSLSQKIAECGARYTGLDIANGPVEMLQHRLNQAGLKGSAKQGSILSPSIADESFDYIVAIGCLHHTGNMARAIDECWRLLRPGGSLILMVYYAYSYKRWMQARKQTFKYLGAEIMGYRGVAPSEDAKLNWDYDHNSEGELAPHTDFISVRSLSYLCRRFSQFKWKRRNINQEPPFQKTGRQELLKTIWPSVCGLEIYARANK